MTNQFDYDEFGLFHENAAEYGLPFDRPPTVRRVFAEVGPGPRRLSALVWQDRDPELVLLHGGSQNAHTWDTVAMALDRPLVAIDLPGHGHSDGPGDRPEGQLDAVRQRGRRRGRDPRSSPRPPRPWSACRSAASPPSRSPPRRPNWSASSFSSTCCRG